MSDTVIKVENLSKKYIINHQQEGRSQYKSIREAISNAAKSLNKKLFKPSSTKITYSAREEFWALKDVSFEIKQGDKVGIIGRNGAGKSTLLKLLSRITEPTTGKISIKGRVASLLEVGSGFHPELTGRENIFLNGAVLGMNAEEIKRKFDEIVDFAEVEKFLDTPVKRYSSGMYVRLAFSVAAHLEPEILIVDEVLAVGDARFQKKCLGKMEDVGKDGRTVLFVSHNMSTIQALCSRCIMLQSGRLAIDDLSAYVVQRYLQDTSTSNSFVRSPQKNSKPTITSGKLISNTDFEHRKIQINLEIFAESKCELALSLRLYDAMTVPVGYGEIGESQPSKLLELCPGLNPISFTLPVHQLALGSYFISLDLSIPWVEYYDRVENCLLFEVVRSPQDDETHVFSQSWGFGCMSVPLEVI
ncbi:polysaccharide ABC transporter ATP-binding protein [Aetokthonos hydrillicola Thurmond2011]|jgi:lipopolysaccharide transport system ATP-binding protein|uniref:Polysaccharide ABC transporter ATP-binding protein n=1 Tax=Aetokthonos hydrillicola Thurmond2011 TaxID=2712845 RepID=A0AAP5IAH5_9CYAN|nr:polysaccharide ABC transporter ATP-binding protein [Aetokthonos hydrillicola]MBO3461098.1 ATP-binding cassette domain-containing protein [Aetokthonos hydrillicola CCALA 1050]MBW4590681.1 ATP-binding cassette domain-containing protein [Aetokthonos hydrillicola CCALA 1050]MDR9897659.1 polysaccharide ABC transporter ATP-binding protein [Aetokthonos hydrillicola Thurmond2011]